MRIKEACRETGFFPGNYSFAPWIVVLLIYGANGVLCTRD